MSKFYNYINEVELKYKKWTPVDVKKIDDNTLNHIFKMYEISYRAEGLDLILFSGKEIANKYQLVFLIDVDNDELPDAFILFKKTKFGNKLALLGSDGSKQSKKTLIIELLALLKKHGWYLEASEKIENILIKNNIPYINDPDVISKIIPNKIIWIGDGYYEREITNIGNIKKRMFGNPKGH